MFKTLSANAKRLLFMTALGCAALACGASCGSTPANQKDPVPMLIRVSPSGTLSIDGRSVSLNRLNKTLKSKGATPSTPIHVEIPENTSAVTVTAISQELATGKHPRIVFLRPKKPIATKNSF